MTALPIVRDAPPSGIAPRLLAFLAVYFLLQVALRLLAVSSLGVDDAEMVVITQDLAWGYGSQPPLYNWLQIGAFSVLGFGAPAIVILHFLLLFAAYAFFFFSARLVLGDELKAAAVALGLFTIPQIAWESLHSHTHTLLSLTVAAATLLAFLRVLGRGGWLDYTLFGLCLALGVLAKYSYVPLAVALLLAAASIPALRGRVLSLRMLGAIAFALVLAAPHLHWAATHFAETTSRSFKFGIENDSSLVVAWARGLAAMAVGVASYVALSTAVFVAAVFFPVLGKGDRPSSIAPGIPHGRQFILRAVAAALVLVLVAVLATRATEVKERWLQPILFMAPLVLMVVLEPRLTLLRQRLLVLVSGTLGVIFLVALAVAYLFPAVNGTPFRALAPFGLLADDIRDLGFDTGTVLAEDFYIGGNLRLHLPETMVAEPEYGLWPVPEGRSAGPVLIAWTGRRERPPKPVRALLEELCGPDALSGGASPERLQRRYEHASRARFALTVVRVPECFAAKAP